MSDPNHYTGNNNTDEHKLHLFKFYLSSEVIKQSYGLAKDKMKKSKQLKQITMSVHRRHYTGQSFHLPWHRCLLKSF